MLTAALVVAGLMALWAFVATALTIILAIALKDAEERIENLSDDLEDAYERIESSVERRVARWVNKFRQSTPEEHPFWEVTA